MLRDCPDNKWVLFSSQTGNESFDEGPLFDAYGDEGPVFDEFGDEDLVFDEFGAKGPLVDDCGDKVPLFDDFGDEGPLFDVLGGEAALCSPFGTNGPLEHLEVPSLLVDTYLSSAPPFFLRHPLPPPLRLPFFVDFDALLPPPPRDLVATPSHTDTKPSGIPPLIFCDHASSSPKRERGSLSSCFTTMIFLCSYLVGERPHSTFVFKKGRAPRLTHLLPRSEDASHLRRGE